MMFPRRTMIVEHLIHNHVPSIPREFASAAEEAIDAVNAGDYGKQIELPNGVSLSAEGCVEGMHLDGWIEPMEEF
jgi:hypothetical protein